MEKVGKRMKKVEEIQHDMYTNDENYKSMMSNLQKLR